MFTRTSLGALVAILAVFCLGSSGLASAAGGPSTTQTHVAAPPTVVLPAGNHLRWGFGGIIEKKHVNVRIPSRRLMAVPSSIYLTSNTVPVGQQGPVGSCTTWAIVYALMGWYQNYNHQQLHLLNPMSVYSQVHANNLRGGGGSNPAVVLQDLTSSPLNGASAGADTMAHYSHNAWDWQDLPSASDRANALNYRIAGFYSVFPNYATTSATRENLIKSQLAAGTPVAIGMTIRGDGSVLQNLNKSSYRYYDTEPQSSEGHEMLAVGYDSNGVYVQNSWGSGWGNNGFGYISWFNFDNDVTSAYYITGLASGSNPNQVDVSQHIAQQKLTSAGVPVTFTWNADPISVGYSAWISTDGGAWTAQNNGYAFSGNQLTLTLPTGHSYQLLVNSTDKLCDSIWGCANDLTGYLYSAVVKPGVSDDTSFTLGSTWTRYTSSTNFGGSYIAAQQSGAGFTFSFNTNGTDIGLAQATFTNGGNATITCDGISSYTWSFNSANQPSGAVGPWCHWGQTGLHSMKVTVSGTTGSPWVGIDAFAYLN
jgi:hypothetical protein